MYQRVITPRAKRSLKTLPLTVRVALVEATLPLERNPYAGSKLTGALHFLYSFHCKISNVEYRVCYTIDNVKKLIIIHFAHTRENFYEKVRRLF